MMKLRTKMSNSHCRLFAWSALTLAALNVGLVAGSSLAAQAASPGHTEEAGVRSELGGIALPKGAARG